MYDVPRYVYRNEIMDKCPPYSYSKDTVWKSIEESREWIRYTKKDLAEKLDISPSFFSDCMKAKPDMRLSVALQFTSVVGLSLDDAVRGDGKNTYLQFLKDHGMDYYGYNLPEDSLARTLAQKALIPTFYAAVDFCRDTRIKTIIHACLRMSSRSLYFYFRTVMGSDYYPGPLPEDMEGIPMDFDSLCKHARYPKIVPQFWQGGVRHEFAVQVGLPHLPEPEDDEEKDREAHAFADRLGLSIGQMTKYLRNSRGEQEKANSEPRLKRATEICNALGKDLDYMVEPIYSLQKWTNANVDPIPDEMWTPFQKWYRNFYTNFRTIFRAFPILQVFIERFATVSEPEQKRMTEQAIAISGD